MPAGITTGSDGNLWYADANGKVSSVTTGGSFTEYPLSNLNAPVEHRRRPDDNLWFTEQAVDNLASVTTSGTISEYAVPTSVSGPMYLTVGPDGNIWSTEDYVDQIAKAVL